MASRNRKRPGKKPVKRKGKNPPPRWRLSRFLLKTAFLFGLLGMAVALFYGVWASTFDLDELGEMPQRSVVFDMDGAEFGRLHGENRLTVTLDKVAPTFKDALIAREDSRFLKHHGVDPRGIARAMMRNITSMSAKEGASTLTQQLARNSYPLGGDNLHRKLLEAMLALRIEHSLSKDQIMENYINRIYFGSGVYGLETASRLYFNKPCSELTLGQSATLSGIIRSPNRFSPLRNPEGAHKERDTVLKRMADLKFITPSQAEKARSSDLHISTGTRGSNQENYAMDMVRRELDLILADTRAEEGGLRIYTTIDPQLQTFSQKTLDSRLTEIEAREGYSHPKRKDYHAGADAPDPEYLQGATVVLDNRNGGIRAIVGGRDYKESQYNRAIMEGAARQVGSSFKPFVYAAAMEQGMLPGMLIDDAAIRPDEVPAAAGWRPGNSDGTFGGPQPASVGLIRSRNTMSVRVGELAGLENVANIGGRAGLGTDIPQTPSIYLGSFGATLRDLTDAYSAFPNNGIRKQSYIIERIDDPSGAPLYRAAHIEAPCMNPGIAWLTSNILQRVVREGTAASAKSYGVDFPAGGKTGTTDEYRDAWFVGYTSALTCGVWVGLDKPDRIMSRGYGSALALPIWSQIMAHADEKHYAAKNFAAPGPIRNATVCSVTNLLATGGCSYARTAYDLALPVELIPQLACNVHVGTMANRSEDRRDDPGLSNRVMDSLRNLFRRH